MARISASELAEWQVFEAVEGPFGDRRGDVQAATGAYYTVAVNREPDAWPPLELTDFIPTYGATPDDTDDVVGGEFDGLDRFGDQD